MLVRAVGPQAARGHLHGGGARAAAQTAPATGRARAASTRWARCARTARAMAPPSGRQVCDGMGGQGQPQDKPCVPYSCDATKTACFGKCASNADCAPGVQCMNGSCGKKMKGASCTANDECLSEFCTDGVCCDGACQGACTSCNQVGRPGTCWPIDQGDPDPRKSAQDGGSTSCGQTGACDGFGACSKYAVETVCVRPRARATSSTRRVPVTAWGRASRRASASVRPTGASRTPARKLHVRRGLRRGGGVRGRQVRAAPERRHVRRGRRLQVRLLRRRDLLRHACTGSCRSCALTSSKGKCTPLAAGADDSRMVCKDQGRDPCGTDGRCDGAGGCRKYAVGTVCAARSAPATSTRARRRATPRGCAWRRPRARARPSRATAPRSASTRARPRTARAQRLQRQLVRQEAQRRALLGGHRMRLDVCAQGVCCATACGPVQGVQPAQLDGRVHERPDKRVPSQGHLRRPGRRELRHEWPLRRGGLPAVRGEHAVHGPRAARRHGQLHRPVDLRRRRQVQDAAAELLLPVPVRRRRLQVDLRRDADCARPTSATTARAAQGRPAQLRGGTRVPERASAPRGSAARPPATGSCMSCAVVGSARHLHAVPGGRRDPGGQCTDQGAASCGRPASATAPAPASSTRRAPSARRQLPGVGDHRDAGAHLRWRRHSAGRHAVVRRVRVQRHHLPRRLRRRRRLRARQRLQRGRVRPEASRPAVRRRHRMRRRQLRRRRLLRLRELRQLPVVQRRGQGGHVQPGHGRRDGAPRRLRGQPALRVHRPVRRQRRLPNAPATTSCGTASCSGSTFTPAGNCNGAGTCVQTSTSCGATPVAARAGPRAAATAIARPASPACRRRAPTSRPTAPPAARRPSASAATAPRGSAAGRQLRHAAPVRVTGIQGTCRPVAAGDADPTGTCLMMPASTCGTTGTCDGASHCATYPAGTTCGPTTCAASTLTTFTCSAGG